MKKTFKYFAFAIATLVAIVSCQKIVETDTQDGPKVNEEEVSPTFVYKFNIAGNETTKTTLEKDGSGFFSQWETGDVIGSITTKESGSSSVTPADGETPASFSIKSTGGLSVGDAINVYFPYSGSVQSDPTAVEITIPTAQSQGSKFDYDAMPMVAKEITVTAGMASVTDETAIGTVQFVNLGSLVNFKVYSSNATYATEKVKSVTFNANKALAGTFSVDLTSVDPADPSTLEIDGYAETSVTTSLATASAIGADKEHALDVYMVVAPDSYTGSIMVTTDMATYTFPISSSITIARSGLKGLGLNLGGANAVRKSSSYTWNLSTNSYSSASASQITWQSAYASMVGDRMDDKNTAVNNYIPPTRTSTRLYSGNRITFTPASGVTILSVVITAASDGYANALKNASWNNATGSSSGSTATIIPINGALAFDGTLSTQTGMTSVVVYYKGAPSSASAKAITITPPSNGTLVASASSAKEGTIITLTPTPASGYSLISLSVTDDVTSASIPVSAKYQFAMPANAVTVAATFAVQYNVNISGSILNGNVGSDKSKAAAGETVTLTPSPAANYGFVSWDVRDESSNVVSVTNNSFTMPASDVTVSANFGRLYSLSIPAADNGTVTTDFGGNGSSAPEGATVTITATPSSSGYALNTLSVVDALDNAVSVTAGQFVMPGRNVTITATFTAGAKTATYNITNIDANTAMGSNSYGSYKDTEVDITVGGIVGVANNITKNAKNSPASGAVVNSFIQVKKTTGYIKNTTGKNISAITITSYTAPEISLGSTSDSLSAASYSKGASSTVGGLTLYTYTISVPLGTKFFSLAPSATFYFSEMVVTYTD